MMDKNRADLCHGPLFGKILLFAIPVILSCVVQTLFQAADLAVVGRFCSHNSMAAVGATMALGNLIVNLAFGTTVGANVVIAQYLGEKNFHLVRRAVHTAVAVAFYGGLITMAAGLVFCRPLLVLMSTPDSVLEPARNYMIYFCLGIPGMLLYNMGSAVLRAFGDTRRPLYYIIGGGILNVLLNLIFVIVFQLDVAGVAIATAIANYAAAVLVLRHLVKSRDARRLKWSALKVDWPICGRILHLGIPGGVQGSMFSISNMTIQSALNSFGPYAMAGGAASGYLESLVYASSFSFFQAAVTFTGQNYGAGNRERVLRSIRICIFQVTVIMIAVGLLFNCFSSFLLGCFNPDPQVIAFGAQRMELMMYTYFFCGIMDVVSGSLRGLGHSIIPVLIVILGLCGSRILWVMYCLPLHRTIPMLYLCYPISWILIVAVNGTYLYFVTLPERIFRRKKFGQVKLS